MAGARFTTTQGPWVLRGGSGWSFASCSPKAFGIVEERIADLWVLITPSCSVYSIDHPESGNAQTIITIPQLQALNRLIEVGPCKASGILRTSTGPTEDRPKKASKPTKKVLAAERAK
jgi:hypothetical protein